MKRRLLCASLGLPLPLSLPLVRSAQAAEADWPTRALRTIATSAAGGTVDSTSRIVSQRLGELLGQPVLVENRPGASGVVGATAVLSAPADGYTLMVDSATFATNDAISQLRYDPATAFTPLAMAGTIPMILAVPKESPAHSLQDLLGMARKEADKLSYASSGSGSAGHLAFEMLQKQANVRMVHVPYKGGAPAIADIIAGRVACSFVFVTTALALIRAGTLRALAVSSKERMSVLPDVPTIAESGVPGFDVREWNGVFVRSGTPQNATDRLKPALAQLLNEPEVKESFAKTGLQPQYRDQAAFTQFLTDERRRWRALIKERDIKLT